jgi:curved DNA-binding protein CbpA
MNEQRRQEIADLEKIEQRELAQDARGYRQQWRGSFYRCVACMNVFNDTTSFEQHRKYNGRGKAYCMHAVELKVNGFTVDTYEYEAHDRSKYVDPDTPRLKVIG